MLSIFSSSKPTTATINGRQIKVLPKETILTAALRNGVAFPYSCKVGGCATCKCKLLEGKVKELTNASYILSEDQLRSGYILACQSVPRSDVRIEVDAEATAAAQRTPVRVTWGLLPSITLAMLGWPGAASASADARALVMPSSR